jgi:hypothetical protein
MEKQNDAATAWRIIHRPRWPRRNPLNKRWFIEIQAQERRDSQLEMLRRRAVNQFLNNAEHAALRQLAKAARQIPHTRP